MSPGEAVSGEPRVIVAAQRKLKRLACKVAGEQQLPLIFSRRAQNRDGLVRVGVQQGHAAAVELLRVELYPARFSNTASATRCRGNDSPCSGSAWPMNIRPRGASAWSRRDKIACLCESSK